MDRLLGKVAVITGASSGFGRATAKLFAKEGAKVVCSDVREDMDPNNFDEDTAPTHEAILRDGGEAVFVPCDISDQEQVKNLFVKAVEAFGRIDILFANAGIFRAGVVTHRQPIEWMDDCYRINIRGTYMCCQEAVARFLKQKSKGSIVITCSTSNLNPYPIQAPYSMSKAACAMLVRTLAIEYGRMGITTNGICPASSKTALLINNFKDDTIRKRVNCRIPVGRWGEASDAANAALFLAEPASDFINGALLPVDGGDTNTVGIFPEYPME